MPTRPITILALVWLALIVLLFFSVGAFMKLYGYPEPRPWPILPLAFREYLFLWLALPILWTLLATYTSARAPRYYLPTFVAGFVLAISTCLFGTMAVLLASQAPQMCLLP